MAGFIRSAISFILSNYPLTFLVLGLLFSLIAIARSPKPADMPTVVEKLIVWHVFFAIGVTYFYNFVVHVFFGRMAAAFIGWPDSPFQFEVGTASLGFAVVGFLAAFRSFDLRLAAIVGPGIFTLGAAVGHLYQMITMHNFEPGNAGVIFYTDILIPLFGLVLLWLQWRGRRLSATPRAVQAAARTLGTVLTTCAAVALATAGGSTGAWANGRPAPAADTTTPAVVPSRMSATIEFSIAALERELERKVPKRIATFRDRNRSCWHRNFLGREIHIDCVYSGYVERTGPVSLRAEGQRLRTAVPLYGTVTAQGTHGLLGLIHGTGQGQMTVYVDASPKLRPDWSIALDLGEGFTWTQPPTLNVLGFSIGLTRFVEPQIRKQLGRVEADVMAKVKALDLRGKAETAWRRAFATVKLVDEPEIWMRTTPQTIAFSGLRARGDELEGSVEIAGTAETVVGPEPTASVPTPLPRLGQDIGDPGRFELIVPVQIDYDTIRQKLQAALAARTAGNATNVKDLSIYPSSGKIVVAVRLGGASAQDAPTADGVLYLTATPRIDADNQVVNLADLSLAMGAPGASPEPLATGPVADKLLETLRQNARLSYKATYDKIIASANARLTRTLGDGFRSEGQLTSVAPDKILLLANGLRVDLRASGRMKILYGL